MSFREFDPRLIQSEMAEEAIKALPRAPAMAYGGRQYQTGVYPNPRGPQYEEMVRARMEHARAFAAVEESQKARRRNMVEAESDPQSAVVQQYIAAQRVKAQAAAERATARRKAGEPKASPYIYRYKEGVGFIEKPLPKPKTPPVNVIKKNVPNHGLLSWNEFIKIVLLRGMSLKEASTIWKDLPVVEYSVGLREKAAAWKLHQTPSWQQRLAARPPAKTYAQRVAEIEQGRITTALTGQARIPASLRRADPRLSYLGGEYLRVAPTKTKREESWGGAQMGEYAPERYRAGEPASAELMAKYGL